MKKRWVVILGAVSTGLSLSLSLGSLIINPNDAFLGSAEAAQLKQLLAEAEANQPQALPEEDLRLYSTTAERQWAIECLDCPKLFSNMTDRSLQLDAAGRPHIAYGGKNLYYAWFNGVGWQFEVVDPTPGTGEYASLALDGNGFPHISYHVCIDWGSGSGCSDYKLNYAYKDTTGWHLTTVDDINGYMDHISLALDADGYPHISYRGALYWNPNLKYAFQDSAGWHITTVDTAGGMHTSLALDGDDYPHISYIAEYQLKYAHQDAAGWHLNTLDHEAYTDTSIAVDEHGNPHIGYGDTAARLMYANLKQPGWEITIVDEQGGLNISLAMDGGGYPHFSYSGKYAYQDASGWHTTFLDETGGSNNSLALDANDHPLISYSSGDSPYDPESLNFAYLEPEGWQTSIIDITGWIDGYSDLAYDEYDFPHISYKRDHELIYAYQDPLGWHFHSIDAASRGRTSLVLDAEGYPHIGYVNGGPKYAYRDSTGWHTSSIPMEDQLGEDSLSLALDRDGSPHISFTECSMYGGVSKPACVGWDVRYAFLNAGEWQITTLGLGGAPTSIDMDRAGYPHVIYNGISDLEYTYQDSAGWHSIIIDDGSHGSLALDIDDGVHIIYTSAFSLKYATWDAYGWHYATIDQNLAGPWHTMALDKDNTPHVGYHNWNNKSLNYAYKDGTDWQTTTVVLDEELDEQISLTLDNGGHPHISYNERELSELRLASLLLEIPFHVFIHGSENGLPGMVSPFIASVPPFTPTLPITYVWGASNQPSFTHTAGLTDTTTFTWITTGTQVITVSAHHISTTLIDTHTLFIWEPSSYLPLISQEE